MVIAHSAPTRAGDPTDVAPCTHSHLPLSAKSQSSVNSASVPGPPVDLTGSPDENDFSTLQLHWQVPEVTNGPIREYKIYYSTDKNAPLKEWGSKEVPGSQMVATITSLTHKTRYYFKMKARTKRGWGKLSAVKEILTPPCE